MRKLITIIATLLLLPPLTAPAAAPAGYEYWFDNDISAVGTGSMASDGMELSPDVSALSPGVHYFNFRMNTEEGQWGAPYRKMFFTVANGAGAVSYEYWLDNDHAVKTEGQIADGSVSFPVDLTGTAPGMHSFNCRLYNNQNGWGAPFRKMIFTTGALMDAVAYEYWIDDNYAAKESGAIAAGENVYTVDLTGIRKGMHRFNYRIQNSKGDWGSVYSDYFFYTKSGLPFSAYEYWFDNDYENRQSGTTATNPATFSVDLSDLDKSRVHYFNARVRDDDDNWGAIYRKMIVFYKDGRRVPLKGYRHSLNGVDLGYEAIASPAADGQYTFTVDLPDTMQEGLLDTMLGNLRFEENRVSMEVKDSVHYRIQIETEVGWGVPQDYDIALGSGFADDITPMNIPSELSFAKPGGMEFKAVGFETDGRELYFMTDCAAMMGIYRDGSLVTLIEGTELAAMKQLTLDEGKYVGIICNPERGDKDVMTLRIMTTGNRVPAPVIEFAEGMVTMSCGLEDAQIYYGIDDPDTEAMTLYEEAFEVKGNCTIYARARKEGMDDSALTDYTIDVFKCALPSLAYNGRYVTLTNNEPDATLEYALGGIDNDWTEYDGAVDLGGMVEIFARVSKPGYNSSILSYKPEGYADEEHVETVADGIIPSLYDWADAETVAGIRRLRVSGPVSGNDFIWLRNMEGLRHLDLTAAIADTIPDNALAGTPLVSVSMPAQMEDYGEEVLTQNPGLAAIIWSSKDAEVSDRLLAGIDNPNLLLYLEEGVADYRGENTLNIVRVNTAENVALRHGYPFHAPREFDAKEIVYTREFTKETELGGCAGWETMSVPFDVDRVESHGDLLEPFAQTYHRTGKPFWLYRPENSGWERTAEIKGYAPYLIAMPNHPWYYDDFIIRGEVSFSATNAHVAATPPDPEGTNWNGAHTMWANFSRVAQSDDIWVVNDEVIDGNLPGSVFSRGLRDAEPFECYLTSYSAARHLPVFDASDVEEMLAELGTKIWTENGEICILSGISQRVRIHDTTGQLVRIAEVTAGEVCRVSDIAPGIYIIGHLKLKV